ncbi:hypothetical protein BZA77DRAFT_90718 [Pyronema omphalodes]|nr:hypothetical protein BZA77DRAFT_90718 [Pyronema omphalodes]
MTPMHDRTYQWADYPFPLISTPASEIGYTSPFIKSASKMALVHNAILRGLNAMYLQCLYITPSTAPAFLTFCSCWSEMIHNHHLCEETAYFPLIESALNLPGLAEGNVEEHDAFMPGLKAFDEYITSCTPSTFSGERLYEILDSFAALMQVHLTDEILWIQELSRFGEKLNIVEIDKSHAEEVKKRASKTRVKAYLCTNHDVDYEGGIHRWFKPGGWWERYLYTIWNYGAWRFSACNVKGHPRKLLGVRPERLREIRDGEAEEEERPETGMTGMTAVTEMEMTKDAMDSTATSRRSLVA